VRDQAVKQEESQGKFKKSVLFPQNCEVNKESLGPVKEVK